MPSPLDALSESARAAADQVAPSVVRIGGTAAAAAASSSPTGLVATNAHNLRDRTTSVSFADGRQAQGEVAGVDVDGDLAVLKVDTGGTAPPRELGGSAETGDVVFAVALAAAGGLRVSFGLVSGTQRPSVAPGAGASGEHRAHRRCPAVVGQPAGRHRRPGRRPVDPPDRRRLLPRHPHRRRPAGPHRRPRRRAQPPAGHARRRPGPGQRRPPAPALRRTAGARRRPGAPGRSRQSGRDGRPHRGRPDRGRRWLTDRGGRRPPRRPRRASAEDGGTLELTVVRGAEERTVVVTFPGAEEEPEPDRNRRVRRTRSRALRTAPPPGGARRTDRLDSNAGHGYERRAPSGPPCWRPFQVQPTRRWRCLAERRAPPASTQAAHDVPSRLSSTARR